MICYAMTYYIMLLYYTLVYYNIHSLNEQCNKSTECVYIYTHTHNSYCHYIIVSMANYYPLSMHEFNVNLNVKLTLYASQAVFVWLFYL